MTRIFGMKSQRQWRLKPERLSEHGAVQAGAEGLLAAFCLLRYSSLKMRSSF